MPSKLFSHQATIFPVPDVGEAIAFYRDKMGFRVNFEWEDPPSYAVLQRDETINLHLSQAPTGMRSGGLAYIFVHDVDEVFREFRDLGLNLATPPEDQDYGMRDFDVEDPWGNRITFGKGNA